MLLHLALRLGEEREIPAVAEQAGADTQRERARVPQRIEETRPPAEGADAVHAPGEVIGLLARRLLQRLPGAGVARG